MNLKAMLEKTVDNYAMRTAIVMGEQRVSYAQLDEAANKVAHSLIKMGVSKGDRVAIILPNSPEFVIFYFGIIKAGGIPTPLDTRLKIEELFHLFHNSKPKILVTDSQLTEPILPALTRFNHIERIIDTAGGQKSPFLSYQEILATSSAKRTNIEPAPDDIATISYAGGPINQPRGAILSHHSLTAAANSYTDGFQQTEQDVSMLFSLPMYHMYGLASVLLASINKGSTVVIAPGTGRSISSFLASIERERGTLWLGVPYIFALAVNVARREGITNDLSSLRLCASGGAALTVNLIRQFKKYFSFNLIDVWGLTEAVSHVTSNDIDGTGKLGSIGKTLPGWETKIVDNDSNELPRNQEGEIIVKGLIMKGYYNNPEATAEVLQDGWLHTGDIGKVDTDGYHYITGRKKPMLILKGENIYPRDIEEVLSSHPKISRVKVIGVPDELRGEIIRAIIILKDGETATEHEIRQFCQQKIADYKLPKEILFAEAIPETEEIRLATS